MIGFIREKGRGLTVGLLAGAAIGAVITAPSVLQPAEARPITVQAPQGAPLSFAELIDRVSPAVVSVNVITETEVDMAGMEDFLERFRDMPGFDEFFREREENGDDQPSTREGRSLGSGFFISETGYIVTNNHVIANAKEISVTTDNGRELDAELIGSDEQTDLAVLKVNEAGTYPYVDFADTANLKRGDWVVALGNPFGFGGTATAGIVSANGRELRGGGAYTDYIQIDAAINRGNSGGPTFDLAGRVIGVNTAIVSPTGGSVGVGFAIPAEQAKQISDKLIKDGRVSRGWLGVSIQDFTRDMAVALGEDNLTGAIVSEIVANSPAKRAGFKQGDVIIGINGAFVENSRDVTRRVGNLIAGTTNEFEILRDGQRVKLSVTVDERPDDPGALPTDDRDDLPERADEGEMKLLGLTVSPLNEEDRERLGLRESDEGLLISRIERSSSLGRQGVQPGQAILEVNGQSISDLNELKAEVESAKSAGRDTVLLAVRAGKRTAFVAADIKDMD